MMAAGVVRSPPTDCRTVRGRANRYLPGAVECGAAVFGADDARGGRPVAATTRPHCNRVSFTLESGNDSGRAPESCRRHPGRDRGGKAWATNRCETG